MTRNELIQAILKADCKRWFNFDYLVYDDRKRWLNKQSEEKLNEIYNGTEAKG